MPDSMPKDGSLDDSEERKEVDLLIQAYRAVEVAQMTDCLDSSYFALPPVMLLRVGIALRNSKFKEYAIRSLTPEEFLEVELTEWTRDDMMHFWEILKKKVPNEPLRMFGSEFPLSDVVVLTKDGVKLYSRHMVLYRASRKLGRSVYISENCKMLEIAKDSRGVFEVLNLIHNSNPPYDTNYSSEQMQFLRDFAEEYEVPRIKEILKLKHISMDFTKPRGPHQVIVSGRVSMNVPDLSPQDKNYRLYADYNVLCRFSPVLKEKVDQDQQGQRTVVVYQDRSFMQLVLKIMHDPRFVAADLDVSAEMLGRLHKFAIAVKMVRVKRLVETRIRMKPDCNILLMLLKNTIGAAAESIKVTVIDTMPINELQNYLDLYSRHPDMGIDKFTVLMIDACKRRLDDEDVYYDF